MLPHLSHIEVSTLSYPWDEEASQGNLKTRGFKEAEPHSEIRRMNINYHKCGKLSRSLLSFLCRRRNGEEAYA